MTSTRTTAAAAALTATLGLAAASWVVAVQQFTRLEQDCRRRCREGVRSGFELGLHCVGSSIGLMLMLVPLGVMSVTWMSVIAVLVLASRDRIRSLARRDVLVPPQDVGRVAPPLEGLQALE